MNLNYEHIHRLIEDSLEIFSREPQLIVREKGEFLIVGDTHGDADTTLNALRAAENLGLNLLFLGDYVDRGAKQIENIVTLLEHKLSWGDKLIMLRGNHESAQMNLWYGFHSVVASRYGEELYREFAEMFSQLPYAAILPNKIICVHGGVAEGLENAEEIYSLPKGEVDPRNPIAFQLLWNDPCEDIEWFAPSWRGGGARLFGWKAFNEFMDKNGFNLMIRAHEPQDKGYGYLFNDRLLTVFSCRYYGIKPAAVISRKNIEIIHLD